MYEKSDNTRNHTDFEVVFRLFAKLRRVILSDSYNNVAAWRGEFELRDQLTGAVSHRHLSADRRQPEKPNKDEWNWGTTENYTHDAELLSLIKHIIISITVL